MATNKVFMFGTQTLTTTNNGYYSDAELQEQVNKEAMLKGAIYGKVTNQFAYNTFLRIASGVAYGLCELIAGASSSNLGADTSAAQWKSAFANLTTKSFVASTYLTKSSASSTYLTQSNASTTYATKTEVASTYLTQDNASTTYATKTEVASTYLTQDNASSTYVPLTGDATISGVKTFSSQIVSTVAQGTAPFSVASTTLVGNLNADKLDGQDGSYYLPANKQAVSNIGGLVTPDTVLTSNELVGIGTDGEQIRVQLGSGLSIDTSTSPYTIKVEHPITSITETTTEINITVG